jgi:hypothetical protein
MYIDTPIKVTYNNELVGRRAYWGDMNSGQKIAPQTLYFKNKKEMMDAGLNEHYIPDEVYEKYGPDTENHRMYEEALQKRQDYVNSENKKR